MNRRVVVIGGDAAGMSAATQARRSAEDAEDLDVVVFERGSVTSYSACGIPYWIAGTVSERDELIARTPQEHRAAGLDVRTGTEVTAIDLASRSVTARELATGREVTEAFDDLVYAAGAIPVRASIPGSDAPNVHVVRTLDDGAAVRESLSRDGVADVVVIGSGYIGLEIAEACHLRGLGVTVVGHSPVPLSDLEPGVGERVAAAVRKLGIGLLLSEEVVAIELDGDGRARGVELAGGRRLAADVVILGLGVRANSDLARVAGIPVGDTGGVVVDERMRTPVEGVWAAGDCVESRHRITGAPVVVPLGTHANKQGRVVGLNLAGGRASFRGVLGTAITKVCDLEIARTGLSSRDAREAGFDAVVTSIDATTTAGYLPSAAPIQVTVIVDRAGGRLLGAQVVGGAGAGKRIDTLAVCAWNAMTVEEMISVDLAYAPPFSPTWDPVLVAARRAAGAVAAGPD